MFTALLEFAFILLFVLVVLAAEASCRPSAH